VIVVVLLIVAISFVGLAVCLIVIFVGIGCARRSLVHFTVSTVAVIDHFSGAGRAVGPVCVCLCVSGQ